MGYETGDASVDEKFEFFNIREEYDVEALRGVYDGMLKMFPAEELDDFQEWEKALDPAWRTALDPRGPQLHLLVCRERATNRIVGSCCGEFYVTANCSLISYLVVEEEYRRHGLLKHVGLFFFIIVNQAARHHHGRDCDAFFAEIEKPNGVDKMRDARQVIFSKFGFGRLDFDYVQPPLSSRKPPCEDLLLIVRHFQEDQNENATFPAGVIQRYLTDFCRSLYDPFGYDTRDVAFCDEPWMAKQMEQLGRLGQVPIERALPWGKKEKIVADDALPSVAVIGAGAAGLACAHRLLERCAAKVTVFEAQANLGGRLKAVPLGTTGLEVDLGAEIVHGDSSVLNGILKEQNAQLRWAFNSESREGIQILSGGRLQTPAEDEAFRNVVGKMAKALEAAEDAEEDISVLEWAQKNGLGSQEIKVLECLAQEYAAPLQTLGLVEFGKEMELFNYGEDNYFLEKGCLSELVTSHYRNGLEEAKVNLSTCIKTIEWGSGNGIVVHTEAGLSQRFDHVVVTVPLAYLKAKQPGLRFTPELPDVKRQAISAIQMHTGSKIVIAFQDLHWPEGLSFVLCPEGFARQVWTKAVCVEGGSTAVAVGFFTAQAAEDLRHIPEKEAITRFLAQLDQICSGMPKKPSQHIYQHCVFHWSEESFVCGAYSSPSVAVHPWGRAELARPLGTTQSGLLLFAGEATSLTTNGTVQAAIESGLREANRIIGLKRSSSSEESRLEIDADLRRQARL